jgi:small nuclear ribonucleoprotein (snRNP)-like protein
MAEDKGKELPHRNEEVEEEQEAPSGFSRVVVRTVNGEVLKGYTQDFNPNSFSFHLYTQDQDFSQRPKELLLRDLKAVFFVKSFEGNPEYRERKVFVDSDRTMGRRVEVRFKDGELLQGSTLGFNPNKPGFFLFPPDPNSNNIRVFVVTSSLDGLRFL